MDTRSPTALINFFLDVLNHFRKVINRDRFFFQIFLRKKWQPVNNKKKHPHLGTPKEFSDSLED